MILVKGNKLDATIKLSYNHGYVLILESKDSSGYISYLNLIDYSKLKIETQLEYTYLYVKLVLPKDSLHNFINSSNLTRMAFTAKLTANAESLAVKGFNFLKEVIVGG